MDSIRLLCFFLFVFFVFHASQISSSLQFHHASIHGKPRLLRESQTGGGNALMKSQNHTILCHSAPSRAVSLIGHEAIQNINMLLCMYE